MKYQRFLVVLVIGSSFGCTSNPPKVNTLEYAEKPNNKITYGMIKRELKIGVSTQADVLKQFGSPNNMTYQSKGELWIYDQIQTETSSQSESNATGLTIGSIGAGSGGALIGASGRQNISRMTSSVRTLTIILDFNNQGILIDISARQGGY